MMFLKNDQLRDGKKRESDDKTEKQKKSTLFLTALSTRSLPASSPSSHQTPALYLSTPLSYYHPHPNLHCHR